eukprot:4123125-Pyramimonas_sp.AAC.1
MRSPQPTRVGKAFRVSWSHAPARRSGRPAQPPRRRPPCLCRSRPPPPSRCIPGTRARGRTGSPRCARSPRWWSRKGCVRCPWSPGTRPRGTGPARTGPTPPLPRPYGTQSTCSAQVIIPPSRTKHA